MSSNIRLDKTCMHCGEPFVAKTTTTQFCGDKCAKRAYKKRKKDEKVARAIVRENEKRPFNPVVKDKEFLNINEACMLLGASRWTLYRLISSGKVKATKLGRKTIIKRDTINKLFK